MKYQFRIARPVSDLKRTTSLYREGLGLKVIDAFEDHQGFDGAILGAAGLSYQLEFTRHRSQPVPPRPTPEDLIVFYVPNHQEWQIRCQAMIAAGFRKTRSFNPYWDFQGQTFEDPDGYRVVIENSRWAATQTPEVEVILSLTNVHETELLADILQDADEDPDRVRRLVSDRRHTGYLALCERLIVGAVLIHWEKDASEILYLAISPERRGMGLGTSLIRALADQARSRTGALLVGTDNTSVETVSFYQRCGFRMDHVRRDYFAYLQAPVVMNGVPMRDMLVLKYDLDSDANPAVSRFAAITKASARDLPRLFEIWETSARATHSFLSDEDFQALVPDVKEELAAFSPIYCLRKEDEPYAMLGVAGSAIEMLFVHADHRGTGAGRLLIEFALEALHADRVDVNEQNTAALGFYHRMGFETVGRSDTDGTGRPFPLLHLAYSKPRPAPTPARTSSESLPMGTPGSRRA